jgi:hypothetical protein
LLVALIPEDFNAHDFYNGSNLVTIDVHSSKLRYRLE